MRINRWGYLLSVCLAVVLVGVIAAERADDDPFALPEDFSCKADALAEWQAEQHARLDAFALALDTDADLALARLYEVGMLYQQAALTCGYIPPNAGALVINTGDIPRVMTVLDTLSGDPLNGQLLYNGETTTAGGEVLGCVVCHDNAVVAPLTSATWTRWDEQRRLETAYRGETFDFYIAESILLPWEYLAPDYPPTMPNNYAAQLGYQDLADIIAYLESQDQLED